VVIHNPRIGPVCRCGVGHGREMTSTQQTASPILLHADEPAELLAQARLFLGTVPRDCVVLIGHDTDHGAPLATMVSLSDVRADLRDRGEVGTDPDGSAHDATDMARRSLLGAQVLALRTHGCAGAFAIVVLEDGYLPCADEKNVDLAQWAAAQVLLAAHDVRGDFALAEVCVVLEGEATRVRMLGTDREGMDLAVRAEGEIPAVEDTLVAAQAVAAGWVVPDEDLEGRARVRRAGAMMRAALVAAAGEGVPAGWAVPEGGADGPRVPELDRAASALWRLRRGGSDALEERSVSECEHLLPAVSRLATISGWNTVLRQVVCGGSVPVDGLDPCPDDVLVALLEDPARRPDVDVRAGGSLYEALIDLRELLDGAVEAEPSPSSGTEESDLMRAWVHASVVLGLLAWWNHRFATAGHIADEIGRRPGREDLARLLTHLTEGPLRPAWRPDHAGPSRPEPRRRTPTR
jgi:hypothetical protein